MSSGEEILTTSKLSDLLEILVFHLFKNYVFRRKMSILSLYHTRKSFKAKFVNFFHFLVVMGFDLGFHA